ncbi:acylneuraminate cytidylyltransferase family protein [Gelidibacter maritimus]|uniref:Acylneuraminate cytidylyltransferase family protein n=1 Tax=Gelidibacter maritimus TaxID=2761487 RepID=A0A7W2R409_9FLAO|nr:acylneuraminate cytidylyltransferase family protein [Gelidibacter maritimus]MBA6153401.1 acylneuraminate cytidylyltransferase family protein [Gelidibacter maritimus]
MKPLIIIPARGGSKGVPGKNIKLLNGKPLIQYTIEAALEITTKENIIVSTDSPEIKSVVEEIGIRVPSLRPKELATDRVGTYEVLLHEINQLEKKGKFYDYLIFLQATSPFRTGKQIKEALKLYNDNMDMLVSVKETKANPYFVLREEDEKGYLVPSKSFTADRRQDVPKVWELNGAIYIINTNTLKKKPINQFTKVKKYVMDEFSSIDIDTMMDWQLAEKLLA